MRATLLATLIGLAVVLTDAVAFAQPAQPAQLSSDEPRRSHCRDDWFAVNDCFVRPWTGPQLYAAADFGGSGMVETGPFGFGKGLGSATTFGPSWALRGGIDVLPWLGVEGRYVGMYNAATSSVSPAGSLGYLTTGGEAVIRLILPVPYVRPYAFGGVGIYDNSLTGSASARAASALTSNTAPGVPMGIGVEVPLTWHLSVGAEATYHFLIGESFATTTAGGIDGGDLMSFNAVARIRF